MTKKRILIVDHSGITALDTADILRDLGYEVTGIAMTAEGSVELAGKDRPHVVLMNLMLADIMDGPKSALKIWELYQIPVIYLMAYGSKMASKFLKTPPPEGFGYIVEPYTAAELKSEIERLIG